MSFNPRVKGGDKRYPSSATNPFAPSVSVAAGAGWLYDLYGYNDGTIEFIQVHDAAAMPANGAVPLLVIPTTLGSRQWFEIHFPTGLRFVNGLQLCNSTTDSTKTNTGSTSTQFLCGYSLKP